MDEFAARPANTGHDLHITKTSHTRIDDARSQIITNCDTCTRKLSFGTREGARQSIRWRNSESVSR